jgi:hypothetical protein
MSSNLNKLAFDLTLSPAWRELVVPELEKFKLPAVKVLVTPEDVARHNELVAKHRFATDFKNRIEKLAKEH